MLFWIVLPKPAFSIMLYQMRRLSLSQPFVYLEILEGNSLVICKIDSGFH